MSFGKWQPSCVGLNVLIFVSKQVHDIHGIIVLTHTSEVIEPMRDQHGSCAWWRHQMETFFALLAICAGNSPVPGEFPAQRPVTRSFEVFFDLRLIKRLSKQPWGWWYETLSRPLWRHRNGYHKHCFRRCSLSICEIFSITAWRVCGNHRRPRQHQTRRGNVHPGNPQWHGFPAHLVPVGRPIPRGRHWSCCWTGPSGSLPIPTRRIAHYQHPGRQW